jgi:23S rRNA A1618 N6-methylase RlmF
MDLIRDLMGKYGILKENVIRHKDYTMRKWDIGDNFRYPQYATYAKFQDDLIKKTVEEKKEDKEIQDLVSR